MLDANSPEFLRRVDSLSKVVNATVARMEDNPSIIIPVLMRLLAVTIVSETTHVSWPEARAQSVIAFRRSLATAKDFLQTIQAQENPSND